MYHGPTPDPARTVTWRSILVGYAAMVGVFLLMVAVSYPRIALAVTSTALTAYALLWLVRTGALTRRAAVIGGSRWLRRSPRPR